MYATSKETTQPVKKLCNQKNV